MAGGLTEVIQSVDGMHLYIFKVFIE